MEDMDGVTESAATAGPALADIEAGNVAAVEKLEHPHYFAHDLGADAVAGQHQHLAICATALGHLSAPF